MKEGDVFMCIALSLFKNWLQILYFKHQGVLQKRADVYAPATQYRKSGDLLSYKLRNLGRLVAPLKTQLATRNFY